MGTPRVRRAERGQALLEYVIVVAALTGVLFAPIIPSPAGAGFVSLLTLFVDVFDIYINSFHTVISLPVP